MSIKAITPAFVIDQGAIRRNCEILADIAQRANCHIVLAQKAFSLWHLYPIISEYLSGTCASGLHEAKLSSDYFGKHTLTYSPAYRDEEIPELLDISSHLDFNSLTQWHRFKPLIITHPRFQSGELQCGLRINPQHSTGDTNLYDPCAVGSRLGITADQLLSSPSELLEGITGIHFHTLCEQGADALEATLEAIHKKFGTFLSQRHIKWMNLGGGHWITKPDYDRDLLVSLVQQTRQRYGLSNIWLEPGEAVAIHSGILRTSVLDIVENDGIHIAILDVSATAHMPDTLEMPYRPDVYLESHNSPAIQASEKGQLAYDYILGAPTCLAGDVSGTYSFPRPLKIGDTLYFDDMAHYTMVKTTTFNGVPHPAIQIIKENGQLETIRKFGYEDFKNRLG